MNRTRQRYRPKTSVERYLERGYRIDQKRQSKEEQIERLRSIAESATGQIKAENMSGTGVHSKLEDCIIRCVDLERQLQDEIDELSIVLGEIKSAIDRVDNEDYRDILELRHLNMLSWASISSAMHCDRSTAWRWHRAALAAVKKYIK